MGGGGDHVITLKAFDANINNLVRQEGNCFSRKWQQNITQDNTSMKIIHNSVKTSDMLIN